MSVSRFQCAASGGRFTRSHFLSASVSESWHSVSSFARRERSRTAAGGRAFDPRYLGWPTLCASVSRKGWGIFFASPPDLPQSATCPAPHPCLSNLRGGSITPSKQTIRHDKLLHVR